MIDELKKLEDVLKKYKSEYSWIHNMALLSRSGLVIASVLENDFAEAKIAAIGAMLLSNADRSLIASNSGELNGIIIIGKERKIILMPVDYHDTIIFQCESHINHDEVIDIISKLINELLKLLGTL
ncbi:MAG: hypothetical protein GF364_20210 [Candidatus Lokiarchaeota archaeon]|nr:hypothetical protein [Candidatus Lokiarchaeota archaeon]